MPSDYSERFRETVLDPEAWKNSARALIEAAVVLEPKIDEFWEGVRTGGSRNDSPVAVYFMLCSFALENLLKAQIVAKRRSGFVNTLRSSANLPVELKQHDLHKLMRVAGLHELAAEEESLLHRLTRSAEWYGRYPVPVKAHELNRLRKSEYEDFKISLSSYSSDDRDDIKRLLRRLG